MVLRAKSSSSRTHFLRSANQRTCRDGRTPTATAAEGQGSVIPPDSSPGNGASKM
jgi:hypothetical protein